MISNEKNLGLARALNRGVEAAQGGSLLRAWMRMILCVPARIGRQAALSGGAARKSAWLVQFFGDFFRDGARVGGGGAKYPTQNRTPWRRR